MKELTMLYTSEAVYLASEVNEKIAAFEVWLRQMAASDIPTDRQIGFQEAVEKLCESFSL